MAQTVITHAPLAMVLQGSQQLLAEQEFLTRWRTWVCCRFG